MKPVLFLITFLTLSQIVVAQQEPGVTDHIRGLHIDKTSHDLGTLTWGRPMTISFVLTNNRNEPLVITNAKGSCKCTKAQYDPSPVLPGKSTVVKAVFDGKFPGAFQQTVYVTTNFSKEVIALRLKGTVVEEIGN